MHAFFPENFTYILNIYLAMHKLQKTDIIFIKLK
jgi:hypothetical protein